MQEFRDTPLVPPKVGKFYLRSLLRDRIMPFLRSIPRGPFCHGRSETFLPQLEPRTMGVLLGFAPFVAFALLSRFVPASISLWSAAAVSAMLILRQKTRGGSMKILEVGTFVLFAALGTYALVRGNIWDIPTVRSVVDGGLLLIILLSVVVGRPFTLQYAREQVSASVQDSPRFIRTNYIITAIWALAMAVIVLAD